MRNEGFVDMSKFIEQLREHGVSEQNIQQLIAKWGGFPLYVPRTPRPNHPIAQVAGLETMRVLCAIAPGMQIIIPQGTNERRIRLVREVSDLRRAGLSAREIAERLGLHIRQVYRLASLTKRQPSG
jgi:DNA-binding transcriptional MerR regulator